MLIQALSYYSDGSGKPVLDSKEVKETDFTGYDQYEGANIDDIRNAMRAAAIVTLELLDGLRGDLTEVYIDGELVSTRMEA